MSIDIVSSSWTYDVFLSFRGKDTRQKFLSHLDTALNQQGIKVFKDDKELDAGTSISPELFKAIEESRFLVVVFSENYASSTWCLDELAKIVECKNTSNRQIVLPIFYEVEPTVVRKQIGNFQEVFAKYEETFRENKKKVQKWRDALQEVANISGFELKDRKESEFIKDIVKKILRTLISTKFEIYHKELVGIYSRLNKLKSLLDPGSDGVRIIGIWGMGGLGKTTIARVVYDHLILSDFEGSSFLANVRENSEKHGLTNLQKQLLSDLKIKLTDSCIDNVYDGIDMLKSRLRRKKVLIVIDDVVDDEQLEGLAGKRDWFGLGSKIIITSRDKNLLMTNKVDEVYELQGLNVDEAFQLFCMKAFEAYQPKKEYEQLSKHVVEYASGLPLALKILGSFLHGKTIEEWESTVQRLKTDFPYGIRKVLQISFDGLEETEKKIFLDIACFFKGKNRDYITKILNYCDFYPTIGISVLVAKSLISISDHNIVWMHDLLQEMGQQIVKRQCPEDPGKCSRLWKKEEVHHVLTNNMGTEKVEAIKLDYFPKEEMPLSVNAKVFSNMTNVRLLMINNVQLSEGFVCLPNKLRYLHWHGYPLKSLPSISQLLMNNLKFMAFSHSKNLLRTTDFIGTPNLEELHLDGCTRLCKIDSSLFVHKWLKLLNLTGCTSLTTLPRKIVMKSLERLVLSGCSKLRSFPEIVESMDCLSELLLDGAAIKALPSSVKLLSGLVSLNLEACKNLESLPATLSGLKFLRTLNLSGCSKLKKFPQISERMEHLSELSLDGTAIEELPLSIQHLSGLIRLYLKNCNNLVRLPNTINGLQSLETLNLSGCSKLENVPENLGKVESLKELDLSGTAIRQLPPSIFNLKNLQKLSLRGRKGALASTSPFLSFPKKCSSPMSLMLPPNLSGLSCLEELDLSGCNLGEGAIPNDICNLSLLEVLDLRKNNFVSLPGCFNRLSKLQILRLEDCKRLQYLPELPSSVISVSVDGCGWLETLSGAFKSDTSDMLMPNTICINCLKLVDNINFGLSMLKGFLEGESDPRYEFHIVFPGSKIPEWFIYQTDGSPITIACPPDFYNINNIKKMFVGYAICCVFHVHKHGPPTVKRFDAIHTHVLNLCMKQDEEDAFTLVTGIDFHVQPRQAVSDHLWLTYWSNKEWYNRNSTNSFWLHPYSSQGLEVKRFGVHPIYVDEVEELNKMTKECRTWNFTDECNQLIEYVGAEASASDKVPY